MRELSQDVKIDKLGLDEAAAEQAGIYYHWAQEAAEARAARDKADNRVEYRKAEIALNLRRNPPANVKITEASIAELVCADPEIIELEDKLVEANKKLALAEGALRALDHKKSMIDNLVRLHLAGYYGDPTGSGASDSTVSGQRANLNKKQNQGQ